MASQKLYIAFLLFSVAPFLVGRKEVSAQFTISGDFDGRGEFLNLHRTVPDSLKSNLFSFTGSATLYFEYKHKRWDTYLSPMVTYSSGTNLFSYVPARTLYANVYEGWVQYQFTKRFSLQAGRIYISYEDYRFFQARDWDNLVSSHNAVIAHWLEPDTNFMADLGFAANNFSGGASAFNTSTILNSYRYMGYTYMHKKFYDDQVNLTFSDIFDAYDNGVNHEVLYGRNTIGITPWLSWPDWDLSLSGFYQFGHITDGRRLSSFYYSGYFSYQVTDWLTLMAAYEHLSGDNFADTASWEKVVHGFSLLYGAMHSTTGRSGIFNTSYRSNITPGLNNLYLDATFNITDDISLETTYHWFSIPHAFIREYDPATKTFILKALSSNVIHELDLLFTYTGVKNLEIDANYSLIIPDLSVTGYNGWEIHSHKLFSYAYIELDWTPTFLGPKGKKEPSHSH